MEYKVWINIELNLEENQVGARWVNWRKIKVLNSRFY